MIASSARDGTGASEIHQDRIFLKNNAVFKGIGCFLVPIFSQGDAECEGYSKQEELVGLCVGHHREDSNNKENDWSENYRGSFQ
jgi:hypothetical protein